MIGCEEEGVAGCESRRKETEVAATENEVVVLTVRTKVGVEEFRGDVRY